MARVWVDGFESGSLINYPLCRGGVLVTPPAGMTGRWCLQLGGMPYDIYRILQLSRNYSEVYMMFRYYGSPVSRFLLFMDENGVVTGTLAHHGTPSILRLKAFSGDNAIELDAGTTTIYPYVVYRFEVHYKPSNSEGIFRVKVDGRPIEIDYTGCTTAGLNSIRFIRLNMGGYDYTYFDDLIIDDANWIGNSIVKGIVPIGPGYYSEWKPSTSDPIITNTSVTKLLLHADWGGSSTTISDSSLYTHSLEVVNSAVVDNSKYKFGDACLYLPYNGDYVSLESEEFSFNKSPFTVDMWINLISNSTLVAVPNRGLFSIGGNNGTSLEGYNAYISDRYNKLYFRYFDSDGTVTYEYIIYYEFELDTWYHVAVIRGWGGDYTKFAITINGVAQEAVLEDGDSSLNITSTEVSCIGMCETNYSLRGYIDEFRITAGAAWTSNFTPPTAPYTNPDQDAAASTNWSMVDELPPVDTDYVYTDVLNAKDCYNMTELTDPVAGIRSVSVHARCRHLGEPEPQQIQLLYRRDGSDYTSDSLWVPESFSQTNYKIWEKDPSTGGSWDLEVINDSEFGVKAVE